MTRTAGKLRYMPTPRLLDDSKNIVGESPLWHPEEGSLYWTDVNGFRIHRHILKSGEKKCWSFAEPVCALSLTTAPDRILVALGSRLLLWRPLTDERTDFASPRSEERRVGKQGNSGSAREQ